MFITLGKTSSQNTATARTWYDTFNLPDGSYSIADIQGYFEFQHELGMILLIYLMVLILLQIFKATLNLSSKNTKL